ncbi:MAG: NAD(P)-binding protein [Ignavibacteriales bacterium]|nr:NAD(P)-binding protein [Ignavibacteriales bacterium]
MYDIIALGGGISGLASARILHDYGNNVIVLDKGNKPGGRFATRRVATEVGSDYFFDYGITTFEPFDFNWSKVAGIKDCLAKDTTGTFSSLGMRSILEPLATGLKIRNRTKVVKIDSLGGFFKVFDEAGNSFDSHKIILTFPIPQSLQLLIDSGIDIDSKIKSRLELIKYSRDVVIMIASRKNICDLIPAGLFKKVIENHKRLRNADNFCYSCFLNEEFVESEFENDSELIKNKILDQIKILRQEIIYSSIHKWRFSRVSKPDNDPFLRLNPNSEIFLLGDAFGTGTAFSALTNAIRLGEIINSEIEKK